ncbi:hypothetical protein GCM10023228_05390 [Brevibacillus fulvus]
MYNAMRRTWTLRQSLSEKIGHGCEPTSELAVVYPLQAAPGTKTNKLSFSIGTPVNAVTFMERLPNHAVWFV